MPRMRTLVALVIAIGIAIGIGVGAGIPRLATEAPEAAAAKRVTWRCLAQLSGHADYVHVHNASTAPIEGTLTRLSFSGVPQGGDPFSFELLARESLALNLNGAAVAEVRGPSAIVVAGYTSGTEVDSQIACAKRSG